MAAGPTASSRDVPKTGRRRVLRSVHPHEAFTQSLLRDTPEAERERRAKVIIAEGELQASKRLAEAAGVLSAQPSGMQLRFLQTAQMLGGERNTTLFFPLPTDLLQAVMKKLGS